MNAISWTRVALPVLMACGGPRATLELTSQGQVVPDFLLEDVNLNSPRAGESIGPSGERGRTTAWYFGHANCGYCSAQFGELDALAVSLGDAGLDVGIFGINNAGYEDSNPDITEGRVLPWLQDPNGDVWVRWGAEWRDLYLVNADGEWVETYNLTTFSLADEANREILIARLTELGGEQ
ncbi:MAG: peroxiredoxin family protein [Myxococcota bacterium]